MPAFSQQGSKAKASAASTSNGNTQAGAKLHGTKEQAARRSR
jgi:hypothetical protein